MADEFATRVTPVLQPLLEPDETLAGVAAATLRKTFSGGLYAIGVTDRRLILQALDRKFAAKEPPVLLPPTALASGGVDDGGLLADAGGFGTSDVVDALSVTVELETTDGRKFKLMMMTGGDGGLATAMAGGETQTQGVRALLEWLGRAFPKG
jgi:hypothetical protein